MKTLAGLDIADAHELIGHARVKAVEIGVPMRIAINDESANRPAASNAPASAGPGRERTGFMLQTSTKGMNCHVRYRHPEH